MLYLNLGGAVEWSICSLGNCVWLEYVRQSELFAARANSNSRQLLTFTPPPEHICRQFQTSLCRHGCLVFDLHLPMQMKMSFCCNDNVVVQIIIGSVFSLS